MGHGDNCNEHDLPNPCDLCRIDGLQEELESVRGTFSQITSLMERCRQLELANQTQNLMISNMERHIKELLIGDATKTEQIATIQEHIFVLKDLITGLQKECNPLKYWEGGPR